MSEQTNLNKVARSFQTPMFGKSLWQAITSFGGFFLVCAAMYVLSDISYWLALALTPLAAGFLVRIFIIQHDCGHMSLFASRRLNNLVGLACSVLTMTPYASWQRQHAGHHGTWNNLDRRETGADIYSSCLTVAEYRELTPARRFWYRLTRHPLTTNLLLPPLIFTILYRLPFDMPRSWKRERRGVYLTTLALAAVLGGLGLMLGYGQVAAVQLPVIAMAATIGVWLFAVQHRGPRIRWARSAAWTRNTASLEGSTYLRLPPILRWFTGNIGFHHVHHLAPQVPNYRLRECHESISALHDIRPVGLGEAFRALSYALWDETRERMVTFRELGHRPGREQPDAL